MEQNSWKENCAQQFIEWSALRDEICFDYICTGSLLQWLLIPHVRKKVFTLDRYDVCALTDSRLDNTLLLVEWILAAQHYWLVFLSQPHICWGIINADEASISTTNHSLPQNRFSQDETLRLHTQKCPPSLRSILFKLSSVLLKKESDSRKINAGRQWKRLLDPYHQSNFETLL